MTKKLSTPQGTNPEIASPSFADAIESKLAEVENIEKELSELDRQAITLSEDLRTAESERFNAEDMKSRTHQEAYRLNEDLRMLKANLQSAPARLAAMRLEPNRIDWIRDFDMKYATTGSFGFLVRYQRAIEAIAHHIRCGDAKARRLESAIATANQKHSAACKRHEGACASCDRIKTEMEAAKRPKVVFTKEAADW